MYAFEIERPATVADAVAALKAEDAQPLGGGQTLIPTLKQRLASPSALVSLAGIAEMKGVAPRDGRRRGRRAVPGPCQAGQPNRRPGGPQPRHHRRFAGQ